MFFNTKRNPRKTTRQTLSTEQLEPKAMFSVSPVEPVVALDVGPVNQAGYDCTDAGTCSVGFMKIGDIKGEVKHAERVGKDGRMIVHPQFNVGEDGRVIVHPQFNVGEDGRMIVHPQFNVGEDGRVIVHPQFNVGEDGLAQANQQPSLTAIRDVDIASESLSISTFPNGSYNFMPKPNREIASGGKSNGYAEAVGLDSSTLENSSSDSYSEVEWTYFAARQEVFARMGR